jgi:hypothetical protein
VGKARAGLALALLTVGVGLFVAAVWLMFHNPVLDHGVSRAGTSEDNWTCLAPYDIVLFGSDNSYGGQEVNNFASVKARCDSAAKKQFAAGSVAGVAAVASLGGALVIVDRPRNVGRPVTL